MIRRRSFISAVLGLIGTKAANVQDLWQQQYETVTVVRPVQNNWWQAVPLNNIGIGALRYIPGHGYVRVSRIDWSKDGILVQFEPHTLVGGHAGKE